MILRYLSVIIGLFTVYSTDARIVQMDSIKTDTVIKIIHQNDIKADSVFKEPVNAFQAGEYLEYNAKYGLINGGIASLSLDIVAEGYSYVYYSKAVARTTGIAKMFQVLDIYESYFDINTGYPRLAVRNVREGNYEKYNELRFDQENNRILSTNSGVHKVNGYMLDVLSMFYYARTYLFRYLSNKDRIEMNIYFNDKFYPLVIHYNGTEYVKTKFGKVKCMKFTPIVEAGGMVEKEDDIKIWLTADEKYLPIKVSVNLPVGKANLELVKFKNIKGKLPLKEKRRRKKRKRRK